MEATSQAQETLRAEAVALSRYLIGVTPAPELVDRYVAASAALFPDPPPPRDRAVLEAALRHAWALPFLDAVEALLRPKSRLHDKALLMAAVLEATPQHAARFLPLPRSAPRLLVELAGLGALAAWHALGGLVLGPLLARRAAPSGGAPPSDAEAGS